MRDAGPIIAFFFTACFALAGFVIYVAVMYQIIYRAVLRAMRETQAGIK